MSQDTSPVDAVDGSQAVGAVDVWVGEEGLDKVLTVVKGAVHGQVVHVGVQDGRHLGFLDGADLALGVHDEDGHVLLAAQTVDGSRTGISTGGANDSQVFPITTLLALVSADEEVLEEVAEELKSDILEGKGGTVEQLEQVNLLRLVKGDDGGDVLGAEGGITAVDDVLEVCGWDLGVGNVEREDLKSEVLERELLPLGLPVGRQGRNLFWNEQATVGGETFEDYILKREL